MRVCILALANPLFWTRHYVDAFREWGEVLTVGPHFGPEYLVTLGMNAMPPWAKPNDIELPLQGVDLAEVLPPGWDPDLVVGISDFGRPLNPSMRRLSCPKAYFSIDTWQSPRDYFDARHYDFTFAAQREFVPRLKATGARHVHWLPLGCNPAVHYPSPVAKTCDIAFVGALVAGVHEERRCLLDALQARFKVRAYQRVYGDAMCRACSRGRFVFNHAAVSDLNMRVFEALAMGAVLLTNRDSARNGLLDLFEDGKHLLVYDHEEDLVALVERYLADEAGRARIAEAGRAEVLAKHTYAHRVQTMLSIIAEQVPGFPKPCPRKPRPGSQLSEYLPAAPGIVVDLGMGADGEAGAIRSCGPRAYFGVGETGAREVYDHTWTWTACGELFANVDTVLLDRSAICPAGSAEALRLAHALLGEGGVLLLRLSGDELRGLGLPWNNDAIAERMRVFDFHLADAVYLYSDESETPSSVILHLRKRTRRLTDVVEEGLRHIPFENKAILDYVTEMPADF